MFERTSVCYEPVLASLLETLVKVLLALVPRAVIATMHTTMMRANITAYSTAVGPSSFARKARTCFVRVPIMISPCNFDFPDSGRPFLLKADQREGENSPVPHS